MMKIRVEESKQPLIEMAKLTRKRADKQICGDFGEVLYFSEVQTGHGPRVKFYGGSSETRATKDCPSLAFSVDGPESVVTEPWMNVKNCPNAFDSDYVNNVRLFVERQLALLLLTWFRRVDESDVLLYFQGHLEWTELIGSIEGAEDDVSECGTNEELYQYCMAHQLFQF